MRTLFHTRLTAVDRITTAREDPQQCAVIEIRQRMGHAGLADSKPIYAVTPSHPVATRRALHVIAAFDAIKGRAALAAVAGLIDLMHYDVRHLAIELIGQKVQPRAEQRRSPSDQAVTIRSARVYRQPHRRL